MCDFRIITNLKNHILYIYIYIYIYIYFNLAKIIEIHIFFNTINDITLIYENLFKGIIGVIKYSAKNLNLLHI